MVPAVAAPVETEKLTESERSALAPYFTDVDGNVFALTNLPEVVKGALFARYSRSPKSLRRLFLDEFAADVTGEARSESSHAARAEALYEKVFVEYGDDSVAQLGGVHVAVEGASNILTKILERGRLMAYLEQSTRYIPYTDKPGGHWRYVVPPELDEHPTLRARYVQVLDGLFETYTALIEAVVVQLRVKFPRTPDTSEGVWNRTLRAKALDIVRGILPAATKSNVGMYGTGQAYEALLLRMRADPRAEVRACADRLLLELRKVVPAFLKRVDQPDRGGRWVRYLQESAAATVAEARKLTAGAVPSDCPEVSLTEFDADGEAKVVAALLYAATDLPDDQLLAIARRLSAAERTEVLKRCAGDRSNRRHKPGRAFERTSYRFDILSDYGAFRDLQRHRMLTVEWQPLSPRHGYTVPAEIDEAGLEPRWRQVMDDTAALYEAIADAGLPHVGAYAIPMAYRIRYNLQLNAREAMHVIELRTSPQGHPSYRRVCQQMHRLIRDTAGHTAIAETMRYADHSAVALERLSSERALERRREAAARKSQDDRPGSD
jgi:thymidylate synthase ThyX